MLLEPDSYQEQTPETSMKLHRSESRILPIELNREYHCGGFCRRNISPDSAPQKSGRVVLLNFNGNGIKPLVLY